MANLLLGYIELQDLFKDSIASLRIFDQCGSGHDIQMQGNFIVAANEEIIVDNSVIQGEDILEARLLHVSIKDIIDFHH